jgi:phenylpyruvate tautomerase
MPYLRVETNVELQAERRKALLSLLSTRLAETLGKPEAYMMVQLSSGVDLAFAGSLEPAAYVELKSIGLAETQQLSRFICGLLQSELGVSPQRIYIEFIDIPPKYWGWNNSTF